MRPRPPPPRKENLSEKQNHFEISPIARKQANPHREFAYQLSWSIGKARDTNFCPIGEVNRSTMLFRTAQPHSETSARPMCLLDLAVSVRLMRMDRVEINPAICNGRPIIKGTRITVQTILEFLGAGDTIDDLLAEFPGLVREDILAALLYSSKLMGNHFTFQQVA